jgi:hypothetical protein
VPNLWTWPIAVVHGTAARGSVGGQPASRDHVATREAFHAVSPNGVWRLSLAMLNTRSHPPLPRFPANPSKAPDRSHAMQVPFAPRTPTEGS